MVKKLLKQEYNYYVRILVFIWPAVLLLGLSCRFVQFFKTDHEIYYLLLGLSIMLFYVSCIAAILAVEVLAVVRFYKNMYSTEGYLTFTLPVNNHQHILAKLIAHVVSIAITVIVVALGAIIALSGVEGLSEILPELGEAIGLIYSGEHLGHAITITLELVLLSFVSMFSGPLLSYCCISIGQLAKKNRILLAIGAYYLYSVICQVLGTILGIVISILAALGAFEGLGQIVAQNPLPTVHICLWILIVFTVGLSALFYYINIRIMNNKLNLE